MLNGRVIGTTKPYVPQYARVDGDIFYAQIRFDQTETYFIGGYGKTREEAVIAAVKKASKSAQDRVTDAINLADELGMIL